MWSWLRAFALFALLVSAPLLVERLLGPPYHSEFFWRDVAAYSGIAIVFLLLLAFILVLSFTLTIALKNPEDKRIKDHWFLSEIAKIALKLIPDNRRHSEQYGVLTARFFIDQSKEFYIFIFGMMIPLIYVPFFGYREGILTVYLFSIPVIAYRVFTYIRVKKGIFGLNADEASELIAFMSKNRSTNGPPTPFLPKEEIEKIISEVSGSTVEVLP